MLVPARLPASPVLNVPRTPTAQEMAQYGRVEDVLLAQVYSTQAKRQWARFDAGDHPPPLVPGYEDKPVAVRLRSGEFLLLDGHHRTELALQAGQTHLAMYVIDAERYDPANAGRRSAASSLGDDELLHQLGGTKSPR